VGDKLLGRAMPGRREIEPCVGTVGNGNALTGVGSVDRAVAQLTAPGAAAAAPLRSVLVSHEAQ
jgi:hypothetical protein